MLAPLLAGLISTVIMAVLVRSRRFPLDRPNERSLHVVPVPRSGGIAIMSGLVAAAWWLGASSAYWLPVVGLAVASYFDDRHALPVAARLGLHLLAAGGYLWLAQTSATPALLIGLLLAIGWFTNLYNFMDGSDGLAGGMALIGFGTYGLVAWLGGNAGLGLMSWSIATAAAGFLIFNFPPAKIFMGDVGSIPLGFLAGALGVAGWQLGLWPLWFPLVVFAPFVVDTSTTLVRRALRGERVWQAHRQHYYQRLILSGWSHRSTVLGEYGLMLICSAVAVYCLHAPAAAQSLFLLALVAVFIAAMWAIDLRWRQFSARAHD